jgi:hypothetical protein
VKLIVLLISKYSGIIQFPTIRNSLPSKNYLLLMLF